MKAPLAKSLSYIVFFTSILVGCQNNTKEATAKSCREITISTYDESLSKSMPAVELWLNDIQIPLVSLIDTTVCWEFGKHQLIIKDPKSDSIYLRRELIVTDNKDMLWISFYEQSSETDYQRYFAHWKLMDTLIESDPSNEIHYRQLKLDFFTKGQLSDSIISEHQGLYNHILNETQERAIRSESNQTKPNGFSIVYHQTIKS